VILKIFLEKSLWGFVETQERDAVALRGAFTYRTFTHDARASPPNATTLKGLTEKPDTPRGSGEFCPLGILLRGRGGVAILTAAEINRTPRDWGFLKKSTAVQYQKNGNRTLFLIKNYFSSPSPFQ
jgi:hypothetical protein